MQKPLQNGKPIDEHRLLARFWQSASRFWLGRTRWTAWTLTVSLIVIVLLQLGLNYLLNIWNRDFFNALEARNAAALWYEAQLFVPLAAASIFLAATSVWARMTAQRKWRESLTTYLISYWVLNANYRKIDYAISGQQNPEYRIAEDARIATDAPIDLAAGLLASGLTALVFLDVLWRVGGDLVLESGMRIPGYLLIGVIVYSLIFTGSMMYIGRSLSDVIQDKNQNEAEFRAAGNVMRDSGERLESNHREALERRALRTTLQAVLSSWRDLCWQLVRTTLVSHGNFLIAPVVAWVLCAPKYLEGTMTLGELTQAAAAFVIVQGAFNWLVDNFGRIADWRSSAMRVATLLVALDTVYCEVEERKPPLEVDIATLLPASSPSTLAGTEG